MSAPDISFLNLRTYGDLLDWGVGIRLTCDCAGATTEIHPERFGSRLRSRPPEQTLIVDLAQWCRCSRCGQKDRIHTRASGTQWGGSGGRNGRIFSLYANRMNGRVGYLDYGPMPGAMPPDAYLALRGL